MSVLTFPDADAYADLVTLVRRARSAAPDGAVRLQTRGSTLGVWVEILSGSGLFAEGAAIGVRGIALSRTPEDGPVDVVVPSAALADRFARGTPGASILEVPPASVHAAWAGATGALAGWALAGSIDAEALRAAAEAGIAEIAQAAPAAVGSLAVQALRQRVWGRPVDGDVPAGAAFTAYVLGFLRPGETVAVHRSGRWVRLGSAAGHVLAR